MKYLLRATLHTLVAATLVLWPEAFAFWFQDPLLLFVSVVYSFFYSYHHVIYGSDWPELDWFGRLVLCGIVMATLVIATMPVWLSLIVCPGLWSFLGLGLAFTPVYLIGFVCLLREVGVEITTKLW